MKTDPWWPEDGREKKPIGPVDCCKPEAWAPVHGYEGLYEVSSYGRIKSISGPNAGNLRTLQKDTKGYAFLMLYAAGMKPKNARVHQLVAKAFIPNPDGKPQVNHKDGIRDRNIVTNLEWSTNSENNLHSFRELGRKRPQSFLGRTGEKHHASTPVVATSIETGEKKTFDSMASARRAGFDSSSVWQCCKGRLKTHKGHLWSYLEANQQKES